MKNPFSNEQYLKRTKEISEDTRGAYFRDQTAIIHSLAFRRLKHKTQVFFAPQNDHICTRIEHVLHVATIAKSICKGLNTNGWDLDVEMAFAMGLGHDLGHAPFGHDGEWILNKLLGGNGAFIHEINSYRIVEHIANNGKGLNLTYAVKDGIITHNGEKYEQYLMPRAELVDLETIKSRNNIPASLEACIVRFSDKIAYLGRDIEDALTLKLIQKTSIPENVKKYLGTSNSNIISTLVDDIIANSAKESKIGFSDEKFEAIKYLRDFNYRNIYLSPDKNRNAEKAKNIIEKLFYYLNDLILKNHYDFEKYKESRLLIDSEFGNYLEKMQEKYGDSISSEQIVTDYVAGMTDFYAIEAFKQISFPNF